MVMGLFAAPWPLLAVALLCTAAGFAGGYTLKGRLADADLARIEARHAAEREAAARETAARFARAQDAEHQAVTALHATKTQLTATQRRLKDALHSLDPGRCGLSGRARGLLNDAIAAAAGDVPARAAQSAGAAAEPAADPGQPGERPGALDSSERDVALWMADAIAQYEECRARIDAIRRWDGLTHGGGDGR